MFFAKKVKPVATPNIGDTRSQSMIVAGKTIDGETRWGMAKWEEKYCHSATILERLTMTIVAIFFCWIPGSNIVIPGPYWKETRWLN